MQQKGMETKVIYHNILEAKGNTPLIRLNRMADEESAQILVKFEGLNVGGSIKTRTAYNMIREAEKTGTYQRRYHYRGAHQRESGNRACSCRGSARIPDEDHHA